MDCAPFQLYLGVRLAAKPYFRVPLTDVQPTCTVIDLKNNVEKLLEHPNNEMEFIYCGRILNDTQTLAQQRVRHGATIHVLQRVAPPSSSLQPPVIEVNEQDIATAVAAMRKVTVQLSLVKSFSPAVIRDVLEEYPAFYKDLGALAILRNLLLWSTIGKLDSARRLAETYPLLIVSAPFVVAAFRKHGGAMGVDELSDGSIDSEEERTGFDGVAAAAASPALAAAATALRQQRRGGGIGSTLAPALAAISHNQLTDALLRASSAVAMQRTAATTAASSASASTSSAPSVPLAIQTSDRQSSFGGTATATAADVAMTHRISRNALADALNRAAVVPPTSNATPSTSTSDAFGNPTLDGYQEESSFAGGGIPMRTDEQANNESAGDNLNEAMVEDTPAPNVGSDAGTLPIPTADNVQAFVELARVRFTAELQTMREMGLTDEMRNCTALVVCNGDVEQAINMILSGGMA